MFWILLNRIYPERATWGCWWRWTYRLRLWIRCKAFCAEGGDE